MYYIVPVLMGWLCFIILFVGYLKNKKLPIILISILAVIFVVVYTLWGMYFR